MMRLRSRIKCPGSHKISHRLMKSQTVGDASSLEFMRSRRVFEINPEHPIIRRLDVSEQINRSC